MSNPNNVTLNRDLGFRYFSKEDGNLYVTVATGQFDSDGKPTYEDRVVSMSGLDAQSALTLQGIQAGR